MNLYNYRSATENIYNLSLIQLSNLFVCDKKGGEKVMKISLYQIACNPTFTSLQVIFRQKVANKYTTMICNYSQTLLSRPH